MFNDILWDLTTSGSEIGYIFATENTVAPGVYEIDLEFRNRGNRELKEAVTLRITVHYPEVEIYSITPDEWNVIPDGPFENITETVEINGENFLPGTRVYFDSQEMVIEETGSDNKLTALLPVNITGGSHTITVTGPGGINDTTTVTVHEPYYVLVGHKTGAVISQGSTSSLYFTIMGENNFSGSAYMETVIPEELSANGIEINLITPAVAEGENGQIEVAVSAETPVGTYNFYLSSGAELSIILFPATSPFPTQPSVFSPH